eukprot:11501682-Karenia_brevis.AAC.1
MFLAWSTLRPELQSLIRISHQKVSVGGSSESSLHTVSNRLLDAVLKGPEVEVRGDSDAEQPIDDFIMANGGDAFIQ